MKVSSRHTILAKSINVLPDAMMRCLYRPHLLVEHKVISSQPYLFWEWRYSKEIGINYWPRHGAVLPRSKSNLYSCCVKLFVWPCKRIMPHILRTCSTWDEWSCGPKRVSKRPIAWHATPGHSVYHCWQQLSILFSHGCTDVSLYIDCNGLVILKEFNFFCQIEIGAIVGGVEFW